MNEYPDITAFGKTQSVYQWSKETGIGRDMIASRIFVDGLAPEEALSKKTAAGLKEFWDGANDLPFEADIYCQQVCRWFPRLTLSTVGTILGITRERTRQVQDEAVEKFIAGLVDEGFDAVEIRAWLQQLEVERGVRELGLVRR